MYVKFHRSHDQSKIKFLKVMQGRGNAVDIPEYKSDPIAKVIIDSLNRLTLSEGYIPLSEIINSHVLANFISLNDYVDFIRQAEKICKEVLN